MVCGPFEGHLGRPQGEVGFGKFGKVALAMWTWRLGNGDLTIGQFAPHIWQNMANRKIAMWTSQFGKENRSRLKYELG
jgi:hypothetical protein